ncbi:uncharacterized protein SPPG_04352 [Spizellomyces punctatus DAOM BR117]|uniref:Phosphatidic acid phosphatase type 2/haloperoxidase domain-containing protein n=1 Tax=Spizellomyces punctatus (strain DAOM BR117) TaxID=645134 RepID=A0A0L0HGG4_SPIPD|nr:uncharacterized protein SPPG_04352 [Spizellomyces punctatus DAOM BR117]KND00005.1 hypothetical protein SPPG_04352 [Spizellomyces punctatus DAOM BR117]|eukprot:XP_016608044.1 hypothetical protein SPPG_04352 [Spizellomyces punctatus DAOM BR117]
MAASTSLRRLCFCQPRGCFHSANGVCSPLCSFVKTALLAVLPIGIWLLLFTCAQFIPSSWRPGISVDVLPALDELLFDNSLGLLSFSAVLVAGGWLVTGSQFSTFLLFVPLVLRALRDLAATPSTVADVLAFLPYGLLHYISPAVFAIWLWWHAGVKTAIVFAQAFGVQNSLGVITQLLFPTAAPWYNDLYGFAPATYSMPGNPGGLARVDKLFGTHMYESAFNNSPLVFGAMPSLHSGFAVLIMLFAIHFSRRLGGVLVIYMCWQWWATMYLRHHYMVDLFVGALYSTATYFLARRYLVRASAGMGLVSLANDYKLLDVVVMGDMMEAKGNVGSDGSWTETILKSRRAGERDSLVQSTVPLEGVLIDGRGEL